MSSSGVSDSASCSQNGCEGGSIALFGSSKLWCAIGKSSDQVTRLWLFDFSGVFSVSAHHLPSKASPWGSGLGARLFSQETRATALEYGLAPKSDRVPCITWCGVNARVFGANTARMWWFGELSKCSFTAGKSEL